MNDCEKKATTVIEYPSNINIYMCGVHAKKALRTAHVIKRAIRIKKLKNSKEKCQADKRTI